MFSNQRVHGLQVQEQHLGYDSEIQSSSAASSRGRIVEVSVSLFSQLLSPLRSYALLSEITYCQVSAVHSLREVPTLPLPVATLEKNPPCWSILRSSSQDIGCKDNSRGRYTIFILSLRQKILHSSTFIFSITPNP
jgi:hypothetical protein